MAMVHRFRHVLWFCAGVDRSLAKSLRTEYVALDSVGATVLLTAILAFVSGSYALYFVFASQSQAIVFGLLWATIIFNLDRFIVSSIRKQGDLMVELLKAAPRVVLALIISIVIVVPLELRLFRAEIEAKLPEDAIGRQIAYAAAVDRGPLHGSIDQAEKGIAAVKQALSQLEERRKEISHEGQGAELIEKISRLVNNIDELQNQLTSRLFERAELEREAKDEFEGLGPSKEKGPGPQYRILIARVVEKQVAIDQLTNQLAQARTDRDNASSSFDALVNKPRVNSLRSQLEAQEKHLDDLQKQKEALLDSVGPPAKPIQPASLLTGLTIVHRLTQENAMADWTITLLRLLMVMLETSPILVKLLCSRGPYDALRDAAEREEVLAADHRKCQTDIKYANRANDIRQSQTITPAESYEDPSRCRSESCGVAVQSNAA
jgi:hypothetical protein